MLLQMEIVGRMSSLVSDGCGRERASEVEYQVEEAAFGRTFHYGR